VRWETDFAFRKPRCDVILNGSAHAPGGRPAERVRVGLKVGGWSKVIDVVGHREWRTRGPLIMATSAAPFVTMPITYDAAFGGVDRLDPDDTAPPSYRLNPVGRGWATTRNQSRIAGLPLPNTQAPDEEVRSPFGDYRPVAFGPWGRGWPGRVEYGGTYDQAWVDDVFPFLPADFDERYFQSAPPDQQIDPPRGGEEVVLVNLTPQGKETFRLPDARLPVTLFRGKDKHFDGLLQPDTVLVDADARRFSLVWRLSAPYRNSILEFPKCWVGTPTPSMVRAHDTGRAFVRAAVVDDAEDEPA
jgi:hypothetical protein